MPQTTQPNQTTLPEVTVTAKRLLPEPGLGDGLVDFAKMLVAAILNGQNDQLSPQDLRDAGITFQTGHYINRVGPENVGPVENTGSQIVNSPDIASGSSVCFTCNGVNYKMRTYILPDGTINVGTIFPIE